MSRVGFSHIRRFETLDSTNRYLLDEARAGAPDATVAVADVQTAGRGRLGRRWEAPPGSCLLVSVLMRPTLRPTELHLCTAAVALAAADACWSTARVRAELKWPNDLLVGGRKLAGVLAESTGAGGAAGGGPAEVPVVVGVGINVDWPGPDGAGGTSLLAECGHRVDRQALLTGLLDGLAPRREALDTAGGRHEMTRELRERCATLGRRVRVELADGVLTGRAVDIDAAGHLVVDTGSGHRAVAAGDVEHLRADAPGPSEAAGPGRPTIVRVAPPGRTAGRPGTPETP